MMEFAPTIAQLKGAGFASVEGVLEFAGLQAAPRLSPALFVVPERESAAPNRIASGVIDQKVTEVISVVLVVAAQRREGAAGEELQIHTGRIEQAMVGWRHPDASSPCEYAGGRLLSAEGQRVAWVMSFSACRHIRKESQ